jgi:hypothetical protein
MRYPNDMDHLEVLREKIGRLREEIAHIQELNDLYRLRRMNESDAHVAHCQRLERLQAIQQELARLSNLGRKVQSIEKTNEKHRSRLGSREEGFVVPTHAAGRSYVIWRLMDYSSGLENRARRFVCR